MPNVEPQQEYRGGLPDLLSSHYYYSSNLNASSDRKPQTTYPNHWDTSSRGPSMRYLEVSGNRVRYKGPGSDDRDAAAVRADHAVPLSCPLYYFEIEIVNRGRDGFIGIGFAVADVKIDRLPGWEPNSYGYHGDDGHVFSGRGAGRHYGPVFTTGDWIGVVYNRMERTISFTKKGIDLGTAFENVIEEPLYPTVGFRTPDEEIVANFGTDIKNSPFRGDVEGIRKNAMQRAYSRILASRIPHEEGGLRTEDFIPDLIFEYLLHHGHWNSAAAVAKDVMGGSRDVPVKLRHEAVALTSLSDAVRCGKIVEACEIAEKLAPGVFDSNPGVLFSLECQKFCELVSFACLLVLWDLGSKFLAHSLPPPPPTPAVPPYFLCACCVRLTIT